MSDSNRVDTSLLERLRHLAEQNGSSPRDFLSSFLENYWAIIENFPNIIVALYDVNLRFVLANGNGLDFIGLSSSDIEGKQLREVFPPDASNLYETFMRKTLQGQMIDDVIHYNNNSFRVILVPIHDADHNIIYGMIVAQNITTTKRNEEALLQSENRLRSLVETQSAYVLRTDLQGKITYVNPAYYDRFKWLYGNRKDIVGSAALEGDLREEQAKAYEIVQECIKNPGENAQIVLKTQMPDDGAYWILWEFTGIQDHAGQVVEIQCIGFDITQQKLNEEKLIEQGDTLSISLKAANAGVWVWDVQSNTIIWDEQMAIIYGIEEGSFTGRYEAWQSLIYPDDIDRVDQHLAAALNHERKFDTEFRIIRSNGHIRYVQAQAIVEWNRETNEAVRMIGVNIDITEIRESQDELEKALERERALRLHAEVFRNTAEILSTTTDLTKALRSAAGELKRLVAYHEIVVHQVIQNQAKRLLYHNGKENNDSDIVSDDPFSAIVEEALQQEKPLRLADITTSQVFAEINDLIIVPLVARGITIGLVTITKKSVPFNTEDTKIIETFANQITIAMDNAQIVANLEDSYLRLRQAQETILHSARLSAVGQLAAGVAHQVSNPLMTVIGDSHLLMKKIEPTNALYESAAAINRAATRAGEVVHRLLDFSSARTGVFREVDINDSLEGAINLVKSQIAPQVELRTELQENLPLVLASDNHLQDIWINLLLNARDAVIHKDKGIINIKTFLNTQDNVIEITIMDNGDGIDEDNIQKIFEPFYTTKVKGTGLGLPICVDVVKQHHGSISLESTLGEGAIFTIRLPVANNKSG